MKKLTCTLLVAMFTMTSTLFAQTIEGGPILWLSDYFTITNTTTKESQKVEFSKFTSDENNKFTYDVDFCLGVYNGDKIEIVYTPEVSLEPQTAWSYSWNNDASYDLGSAFTAKLSVNSVPYNGSTLTFACNYQNLGNSRIYNIRFKNVHKEERIQVKRIDNKNFAVSYLYYDETLSCTKQDAVASLYTSAGTLITRISFHAYGDVGVAILSPGNYSAPYIVNVTVNNTLIFTEQYR